MSGAGCRSLALRLGKYSWLSSWVGCPMAHWVASVWIRIHKRQWLVDGWCGAEIPGDAVTEVTSEATPFLQEKKFLRPEQKC